VGRKKPAGFSRLDGWEAKCSRQFPGHMKTTERGRLLKREEKSGKVRRGNVFFFGESKRAIQRSLAKLSKRKSVRRVQEEKEDGRGRISTTPGGVKKKETKKRGGVSFLAEINRGSKERHSAK